MFLIYFERKTYFSKLEYLLFFTKTLFQKISKMFSTNTLIFMGQWYPLGSITSHLDSFQTQGNTWGTVCLMLLRHPLKMTFLASRERYKKFGSAVISLLVSNLHTRVSIWIGAPWALGAAKCARKTVDSYYATQTKTSKN